MHGTEFRHHFSLIKNVCFDKHKLKQITCYFRMIDIMFLPNLKDIGCFITTEPGIIQHEFWYLSFQKKVLLMINIWVLTPCRLR